MIQGEVVHPNQQTIETLPGLLLGWTPALRRKVQQRARANLERFLETKEAA